jgi:hypothetical protein
MRRQRTITPSVVVGEIFGYAPNEGGNEDALVLFGAVADFCGKKVVDLALDRADLDPGLG